MNEEEKIQVLQDTHDLFRALLFIHNMHDSVMELLIKLTEKHKSDDQDFINAVGSALGEMAAASDALEAFQNKLDARMDAFGIVRGDMRH